MNIHSDFGGHPDCSATWLNIGFVLQMHTLASSPPVAIREPSGWTWQENINMHDALLSPCIAESARAHGRKRTGEGIGSIQAWRAKPKGRTFVHDL